MHEWAPGPPGRGCLLTSGMIGRWTGCYGFAIWAAGDCPDDWRYTLGVEEGRMTKANAPKRLLSSIAATLLVVGAGARAAAPPAPTYQVTARIHGPDGFWDYATFEPVMRRLYVSRGDGVLALNVDSGKLTRLAGGDHTHEPLALPGGRRLLLTNAGDNSARLVSTGSGELIADIPTAQAPDGAIYDPRTGLALVLTRSGTVTLVDPRQA